MRHALLLVILVCLSMQSCGESRGDGLVTIRIEKVDGALCLLNDDELILVEVAKENPRMEALVRTVDDVARGVKWSHIYALKITGGGMRIAGKQVMVGDGDVGKVILYRVR